jgi:CDP-diacylglycerol--serine O-phosphatidyltransferase
MMEDVDQPAWTRNFFSGVPSPAGAGLVVLPMILSFQIGDGYFRSPATVSVFMVTVAVLMVSPIPTFSFKRIKVPHKLVLPTMLVVGLLTAALISAPWITLAAILFCYIATIPLSIRKYRKHKADDKAKETPAE